MRDSAVEVHGGEKEGELRSEQAREYSEQDFRHGPTIPYFPGGSWVPTVALARLSAQLGAGVPCSGGLVLPSASALDPPGTPGRLRGGPRRRGGHGPGRERASLERASDQRYLGDDHGLSHGYLLAHDLGNGLSHRYLLGNDLELGNDLDLANDRYPTGFAGDAAAIAGTNTDHAAIPDRRPIH